MSEVPALAPLRSAPPLAPPSGIDAGEPHRASGATAGGCPNCGATAVARFCAECGERQPSRHDYSLRGMLADAFHEATSLDGRLVRSVVALLARPGFLTGEWFAGRRGRYVKPFSLFVAVNLLFFVIQPHTGLLRYDLDDYTNRRAPLGTDRAHLAERVRISAGESTQSFQTRFNATLQNQKKSLLIVSIPLFAIAVAASYARRGEYLVKHLVFSLHFWTFFLLFAGLFVTPFFRGTAAVLRLVHAPSASLRRLDSEGALLVVTAAVLGTYLYHAVRRVYGDRPTAAAARAGYLVFAHIVLLSVYREGLFYATLYAI